MKAKINQPMVKILTHKKLLRMFSTFLVQLQVHLVQSQIGQNATGNYNIFPPSKSKCSNH